MSATLTRLRAERDQALATAQGVLDGVEARAADGGDGSMSAAERTLVNDQRARVTDLDAQIEPLEALEALHQADRAAVQTFSSSTPAAPSGASGAGAYRNPTVSTQPRDQYRTAGQMLADAWLAQNRGDALALERLSAEGLQLQGGMLVRAAAPHTTTAETPGLLPVTIQGNIIKNVDAARPFISSIGPRDLSGIPGTSFRRPVVTESVKVGKQTAEKTELEDGQFKVGSVNFTKDTYGGWTNVSRQDIDWTSPGVWDALLTDFVEVYGVETEEAAVTAWETAVTQVTGTEVAAPTAPTLENYLEALYQAAALSYATAKRLPDGIWCSLDMWAKIGPLIDKLKATTAGDGGGSSSLDSFTGNLLNVPRIVVPSLSAGSLIVGVKSRTEVYEDRIGFLTAVQPKVLGVELAYGGYMANGTLTPNAFAKVTFVAEA